MNIFYLLFQLTGISKFLNLEYSAEVIQNQILENHQIFDFNNTDHYEKLIKWRKNYAYDSLHWIVTHKN